MVASLLIFVIYLAFVSLGLPDTVLGAAWPSMYPALSVDPSAAGLISFIVSLSTIVSTLLTHKLTKGFSSHKIVTASIALTAFALLQFSLSTSYLALCIWAIPYGLGAGAIDSVLNNFAATHLESHHMQWLHCAWGLGASIGPAILSLSLSAGEGWQFSYRILAAIQLMIFAICCASYKLWPHKAEQESDSETHPDLNYKTAFKHAATLPTLIAFLSYVVIEGSLGLWMVSYFHLHFNLAADLAALLNTVLFSTVMLGRFLSGWASKKLNDFQLLKSAFLLMGLAFIALALLPINWKFVSLAIFGLACAPIYPATIHATPSKFGEKNSQLMVSMQMAAAYLGSLLITPNLGLFVNVSAYSFPFILFIFYALMVLYTAKSFKNLQYYE